MNEYYAWSARYDIQQIRDGIYFIKNRATNKYMQIEKNAESYYSSGNTIEAWDFDSGEYQKWKIFYNGSGYYRIISDMSNLALTVPNGSVNATAPLVLEPYNGNDRQLWKITKASSGAYIFRPKSGNSYDSDWCMSSDHTTAPTVEGVVIEQYPYTDNTNRRDEWVLARIGYASSVALEGQQKSKWCWVATARMFAKHYYPSVTYTQTDAVTHVMGIACNDTGNLSETLQAINYYISNINGANIDTVIKEYAIYSEKTLLRFLDDEHVVLVARSFYEDMNNASTKGTGHIILIYGYVIIDAQVWFLVKNPEPINTGKMYMISYNNLYNGNDTIQNETQNNYIWEASIVVNTSYANNTIPYYFDQ